MKPKRMALVIVAVVMALVVIEASRSVARKIQTEERR